MAQKRIIPEFKLKVIPSSPAGRLQVQLVEAPGLEREIGGRGGPESLLKQTYTTEMALGHALYEILFHDEEIRRRFKDCRAKYCTGNEMDPVGLRLILDIFSNPDQEEPLLSLPWELLHDGQDWLVHDPTLSIVRLLNIKKQENQEKIRPPLRVLLAYAEPGDKAQFNGEQIFETIRKVITSTTQTLLLKPLPHATKKKLQALIRQGFHFVHFLGHGDVQSQGMLFLEREESPTSDILTETELVNWIQQSEICPHLFVLTACHSGNPTGFGFLGVATALLDAGVEAVVAMQTELYNDEAKAFAETFYRALDLHLTVDDAMQAGRRALHSYRRNRSLEADTARLLVLSDEQGDTPIAQWHLGALGSFARPENARSIVPFPGWAVPVLFLRGDGWLGQGPPEPCIVWPKDNKEMVYIPEGNFYIDKYPVTRGEYRRFASDTGRNVPWKEIDVQALLERLKERFPKNGDTVWNAEYVESRLPATNVRLQDALAYAEWARKHIPTPGEWRKAALSGCPDKEWAFPWEKGEFFAGRCNTRESGYRQCWPVILSEAYDGCNPAEMCDIVGNVTEWAKTEDGRGFLCGGSFKDPAEECSVQSHTPIDNPHFTNSGVGFRCAATLLELMEQSTDTNESHKGGLTHAKA